VARRRRGCANLFPGRRGRHAQPVHGFPLLSYLHLLARLPVAHLSVTFGSRLPIPSFALALKVQALALKFHALLLCTLAVHALTLLALAIEIHAFTIMAGTVLVLALAIHAFTVLALAILPLAIFAFALFLVAPPGLIAIVVAVCPRRQCCAKSE
jgi:hypothetical protein